MGKDVPHSVVGDIDEYESIQLSDEELRIYIDDPPKDDRTRTIQETFMKMASLPQIKTEKDLKSHR